MEATITFNIITIEQMAEAKPTTYTFRSYLARIAVSLSKLSRLAQEGINETMDYLMMKNKTQ